MDAQPIKTESEPEPKHGDKDESFTLTLTPFEVQLLDEVLEHAYSTFDPTMWDEIAANTGCQCTGIACVSTIGIMTQLNSARQSQERNGGTTDVDSSSGEEDDVRKEQVKVQVEKPKPVEKKVKTQIKTQYGTYNLDGTDEGFEGLQKRVSVDELLLMERED